GDRQLFRLLSPPASWLREQLPRRHLERIRASSRLLRIARTICERTMNCAVRAACRGGRVNRLGTDTRLPCLSHCYWPAACGSSAASGSPSNHSLRGGRRQTPTGRAAQSSKWGFIHVASPRLRFLTGTRHREPK